MEKPLGLRKISKTSSPLPTNYYLKQLLFPKRLLIFRKQLLFPKIMKSLNSLHHNFSFGCYNI